MSGEALSAAGSAFGVPDSPSPWGRWVVGPATCRRRIRGVPCLVCVGFGTRTTDRACCETARGPLGLWRPNRHPRRALRADERRRYERHRA